MSAGGGGGRGGHSPAAQPAASAGHRMPEPEQEPHGSEMGSGVGLVGCAALVRGLGGKLGAPEGTKGWGPHWGGRRGRGIDNRGWFDLQNCICALMATVLRAILTMVRVGTGCC